MCEHRNFRADVRVNRTEDGGQVGFHAGVTLVCAQCGKSFCFVGLPGGLSFDEPTSSADRCEARLPVIPAPDPIIVDNVVINTL